jgi:hypothetical protein
LIWQSVVSWPCHIPKNESAGIENIFPTWKKGRDPMWPFRQGVLAGASLNLEPKMNL